MGEERNQANRKPKNNLKKTIIKSIRNLFKTKKENKALKGRIDTDIVTLFEEESDCYKPKKFGNFWNHNYVAYESYGGRHKNLLVKQYLNKVKHYSRDIIINLQKSDTWKIQLTTAINFISSADVDKVSVMHSKATI